MAYGAPTDVQNIYNTLTPEQISQIASGLGFTGDPNSSDYNAFVAQDPTRFEAAVRGIGAPQQQQSYGGDPIWQRYGAPTDVQNIWNGLTPDQQNTAAHQTGWAGSGQDNAFNNYVVANGAQSAFENAVRGLAPPNIGKNGLPMPPEPEIGVGPRPDWWPEDRPWAPGDRPYNPGTGHQPVTQSPAQPPAASNRYAAPQWAQGVWDQLKPWQQTQLANNLGYSGTGQQSAFNDYVVQNNKGADFETMLGRINPQTFGQPMGRPTVPQGAQPYGYDSGFGYSFPSAFGGGVGGTFGAFGQQPAAQANQTNYLSSTPTAQAPQASAFNPGHDYGTFARGSFQFRRGGRI